MAGYWKMFAPAVGVVCLFLLLGGSNGQGAQTASKFQLPQKPASALTPAEQKGRSLYEYYCALCHGKTGKGDGFNSYILSKPPRNFTDRARMTALSDSRIKKTILEGGAAVGLSPDMPAWGGVLTEKKASDLTAFIRTLAKQGDEKK